MQISQKRLSHRYASLIILSILYFPLKTYADENASKGLISAGIGIATTKLEIGLESPNGDTVQFTPNVNSSLQLNFNYNQYVFSYRFKNEEDNTTLYGETDYDDYQLRFFLNRYILEFLYQNYTGYYMEDPMKITGSPTPVLLPHLETQKIALQATCIIHPDQLILAHPYSTQQIQTTSGGSWLLFTGYTKNNMDNKNQVLIPPSAIKDYGQVEYLTAIEFQSLFFGAGYGHNWIYKKLFLSFLLSVFPGVQYKKFYLTSQNQDTAGVEIGSQVKLATGINQKSWKLHFEIQYDSNNSSLDDGSNYNSFSLDSGIYFNLLF